MKIFPPAMALCGSQPRWAKVAKPFTLTIPTRLRYFQQHAKVLLRIVFPANALPFQGSGPSTKVNLSLYKDELS